MHGASCRSFIVRSPPGFASVRRRHLVALSTANIKTCHSPVGMRHTPPIPMRDAYVAPIHVGISGQIYLRWVGSLARDATRCLQRLSSSWTAAVMIMQRPAAPLIACWSLINIPWDPAMAGTALRRRLRRHFRLFLKQRWASFGIELRALMSLSFCACGRVSSCWAVSMAHPSTVLVVLQRESPLFSFLTEIGSRRSLSVE